MGTALVIGAGIGGLAAAVALQRAGLSVKVFERSPAVREAGAGLSLWPNALRALAELGLGDALNAIALRGGGEIRTAREEVLSRFAESDLVDRYGDAVAYVHRAELLALLYEAAGGAAVVQTGRKCIGVEQDGGGVVARFKSGSAERGWANSEPTSVRAGPSVGTRGQERWPGWFRAASAAFLWATTFVFPMKTARSPGDSAAP